MLYVLGFLGLLTSEASTASQASTILKELGCVCFFHLMLNRTFFELNAE